MTSNAFTLRAAAGLPTKAFPIADSTLVIIDAQDEYISGALALPDTRSATANIARILEAARAAQRLRRPTAIAMRLHDSHVH